MLSATVNGVIPWPIRAEDVACRQIEAIGRVNPSGMHTQSIARLVVLLKPSVVIGEALQGLAKS